MNRLIFPYNVPGFWTHTLRMLHCPLKRSRMAPNSRIWFCPTNCVLMPSAILLMQRVLLQNRPKAVSQLIILSLKLHRSQLQLPLTITMIKAKKIYRIFPSRLVFNFKIREQEDFAICFYWLHFWTQVFVSNKRNKLTAESTYDKLTAWS